MLVVIGGFPLFRPPGKMASVLEKRSFKQYLNKHFKTNVRHRISATYLKQSFWGILESSSLWWKINGLFSNYNKSYEAISKVTPLFKSHQQWPKNTSTFAENISIWSFNLIVNIQNIKRRLIEAQQSKNKFCTWILAFPGMSGPLLSYKCETSA